MHSWPCVTFMFVEHKLSVLLYHTMGSCKDTVLCRSLQAHTPLLYCTHRWSTTVLHTQVLYHCTAHTGAVPLYCTHRCSTPVIHTWLMYQCTAHTGAVLLYCTHRCCTSTWICKNKPVPNRTPPKKTSPKPTTPQQSSRLFHPGGW